MENGKKKRVSKKNLESPDDKLLTFRDSGDDQVDWLYLVITTYSKS